jgi:hypothetical protein
MRSRWSARIRSRTSVILILPVQERFLIQAHRWEPGQHEKAGLISLCGLSVNNRVARVQHADSMSDKQAITGTQLQLSTWRLGADHKARPGVRAGDGRPVQGH